MADPKTDPAKAAYAAVDKFVKTGEWPKPGVLPVKVSFRKRLGG